MVSFYNPYGKISMTGCYFAGLIGAATKSAVGVAGMAVRGPCASLKCAVLPHGPGQGVRVSEQDGHLQVELHIKVVYGINIKEAVKSITHKVKYVVEEATGLTVQRVDVCVDDVVA